MKYSTVLFILAVILLTSGCKPGTELYNSFWKSPGGFHYPRSGGYTPVYTTQRAKK